MRKQIMIACLAGSAVATAIVAHAADVPPIPWANNNVETLKSWGWSDSAIREHLAALREQCRYRGFDIKPQPEATGAELRFQRKFAALMSRLDFVPPQRAAHVAWLADQPVVLTGWAGLIMRTEAVPEGVRVTMWVFPRHSGGGSIHKTNDPSIETYLYSNGQVQFLGYKPLIDGNPKVITFN